jgi:hypothetical protein
MKIETPITNSYKDFSEDALAHENVPVFGVNFSSKPKYI